MVLSALFFERCHSPSQDALSSFIVTFTSLNCWFSAGSTVKPNLSDFVRSSVSLPPSRINASISGVIPSASAKDFCCSGRRVGNIFAISCSVLSVSTEPSLFFCISTPIIAKAPIIPLLLPLFASFNAFANPSIEALALSLSDPLICIAPASLENSATRIPAFFADTSRL